MLARIRDAEHTQCMAELTHKLCNLELKVAHWAAWLAIQACHTVNPVPEYTLMLDPPRSAQCWRLSVALLVARADWLAG